MKKLIRCGSESCRDFRRGPATNQRARDNINSIQRIWLSLHLISCSSPMYGDFLFIENVGNLVCPASFDLGEHLRLVLVSTTEGEDKPLKYPTIFNTADVAVITKVDLTEALGFDLETLLKNICAVRPGMPVFQVSARSGQGWNSWRIFCCRTTR